MKDPQYKDLKFDNEKDFNKWLKEKTKYIIHFNSDEFDPTEWYLDEHGEVLHSSPFQSQIWNGKMVKVRTLMTKNRVHCQDGYRLKHIPVKVEERW